MAYDAVYDIAYDIIILYGIVYDITFRKPKKPGLSHISYTISYDMLL